MESSNSNHKNKPQPHAVCVPLPAQSHIGSMTNLAKLLHHKGFHITFVHTEFNYKRLLKSSNSDSLNSSHSFRFETISDGLPPPENPDATQDMTELCVSTQQNCHFHFRSLLDRLGSMSESGDVPPVSCIIADGMMSFTLDAAEELGITHVLFYTVSAMSMFCFFKCYPLLLEQYSPLQDDSNLKRELMEQTIDWIPGAGSICLLDIPSLIWTTDMGERMVKCISREVSLANAKRASAVLIHTFEALEYEALRSLSSILNRVYAIGPLPLLAKQISDTDTKTMTSNLWKNDPDCIQWLDSKEPGSVIYVSFGSITVITREQFEELAWGLANSRKNFLWIVRPDLVNGEVVSFPPEYLNEIKDRGKVASWCDQVSVLEHPAIGGFLTHCGWTSVFESLFAGVPMLCLPFAGDQQANCLCCCKQWGVGIEIDADVKREGVERVVNELLEGDKGKEIKRNTLKWKQETQMAVNPNGGSSHLNLDKLIEEVLLC